MLDTGIDVPEVVNLVFFKLVCESQFTDLTPHGPDGLFSSDEVDQLIAVIKGVRDSAVGA
jgi:type I restriction enzyme R subunit